ncbi:hypothetical protein HYH03_010405 [Edaphochlamys debaryana]|uniref:Uncharacterized protein n=1 Tax=Edaphochlamys debaryana TaxID=47281 RepID=A0A835Y263_9CHLO|nr:hypothetical protein HYH03_010405 [Edaphochlamys debaryana]|eukprot:KAG2491195.1 hypothetical protein HYH03_010405 [Edaphochlamys debaryana]
MLRVLALECSRASDWATHMAPCWDELCTAVLPYCRHLAVLDLSGLQVRLPWPAWARLAAGVRARPSLERLELCAGALKGLGGAAAAAAAAAAEATAAEAAEVAAIAQAAGGVARQEEAGEDGGELAAALPALALLAPWQEPAAEPAAAAAVATAGAGVLQGLDAEAAEEKEVLGVVAAEAGVRQGMDALQLQPAPAAAATAAATDAVQEPKAAGARVARHASAPPRHPRRCRLAVSVVRGSSGSYLTASRASLAALAALSHVEGVAVVMQPCQEERFGPAWLQPLSRSSRVPPAVAPLVPPAIPGACTPAALPPLRRLHLMAPFNPVPALGPLMGLTELHLTCLGLGLPDLGLLRRLPVLARLEAHDLGHPNFLRAAAAEAAAFLAAEAAAEAAAAAGVGAGVGAWAWPGAAPVGLGAWAEDGGVEEGQGAGLGAAGAAAGGGPAAANEDEPAGIPPEEEAGSDRADEEELLRVLSALALPRLRHLTLTGCAVRGGLRVAPLFPALETLSACVADHGVLRGSSSLTSLTLLVWPEPAAQSPAVSAEAAGYYGREGGSGAEGGEERRELRRQQRRRDLPDVSGLAGLRRLTFAPAPTACWPPGAGGGGGSSGGRRGGGGGGGAAAGDAGCPAMEQALADAASLPFLRVLELRGCTALSFPSVTYSGSRCSAGEAKGFGNAPGPPSGRAPRHVFPGLRTVRLYGASGSSEPRLYGICAFLNSVAASNGTLAEAAVRRERLLAERRRLRAGPEASDVTGSCGLGDDEEGGLAKAGWSGCGGSGGGEEELALELCGAELRGGDAEAVLRACLESCPPVTCVALLGCRGVGVGAMGALGEAVGCVEWMG